VERDGELVGVVTYRSVVRTMLAIHRLDVNDRNLDRLSISAAVQGVTFVDADESILALFDVLAEHTYAVVERDEYHIVTDHDLITALEDAIEPFLLIETIERRLRDLFREESGDDLSSALKETFDEDHPLPTPRSVEHCSFGHYLIQRESPALSVRRECSDHSRNRTPYRAGVNRVRSTESSAHHC
jgi:hypothetical protein